MQTCSKVLLGAAIPITVPEFSAALRNAWAPKHKPPVHHLGLAVSGGVDSMALAYLCRQIQLQEELKENGKLELHAFVVDHKARRESTTEAMLVSQRLEELRIPSTILTLKWNVPLQWTEPLERSSFESEARRFRYMALGRACRDRNIDSLLVAHHADDQAETILARLAAGHRMIGLQGMRLTSGIPECWGIHGVHRNGLCETSTHVDPVVSEDVYHTTNTAPEGLPFDRGDGITIHRPFLSFSKDRLKSTCLSAGVGWVEDKTNQDVTRTTRNAARKLLYSARLPSALCTESLRKLAVNARAYVKDLELVAEHFLHSCRFLTFDNRVGLAKLQLPQCIALIAVPGLSAEEAKRLEERHQCIVALFLQRLVQFVSPYETAQSKSLQIAAKVLSNGRHQSSSTGFTAGGVRFQRSDLHAPTAPSSAKEHELENHCPESHVWTLTREPYHSGTPLPTLLVPPGYTEREFRLWDGRFWLQVSNMTDRQLCVRHFRRSDMKPCLNAGAKEARRELREVLRKHAPGDVRWTLPVIAYDDTVEVPEEVPRVLGLPSLGIAFGVSGEPVTWQIRYKAVDLRPLGRSPEMVQGYRDSPMVGAGCLGPTAS
ncbi:hypothetical protein MMC13_001159 [Lambiella insularis]|nr:hypothetical protein [Lambiella insularis]